MTKHQWKESLRSFFGSHIDPERDEQLKGTKREIEDKVKKILRLIKDEDVDKTDVISLGNSKQEPLVEVIEDFLRQYQLLYAHYDHLTEEIRKKVRGKQEKDTSSSNSDSDSDKGSKNGCLENESFTTITGIKHELEIANLEIADLKKKLSSKTEENDALHFEYLTALSKTAEADNVIASLKVEVERSEDDNSKLLVENGELKEKLDTADKMVSELNQRLEDTNREKDILVDENATMRLELEDAGGEVSKMKQQLEHAEQRVTDISDTLKNTTEEKERELSDLTDMHHTHKNESAAQIMGLQEQVKGLEQEVGLLEHLERGMEVQIEKAKQLEDAYNKLNEEKKQVETRLQDCILNLEVAERKMEETNGVLHNNMVLKNQMITDLEEMVDNLKRDLEIKGDELDNLNDNARNIEVKLRLSTQKLRVTEQLLTENEESFRSMETKFQEEQRLLEGRIARLAANIEAYQKMIRDVSDEVFFMLNHFETVIQKFEEDSGNYGTRISESSNEFQSAKIWIIKCKNDNQILKEHELVLQQRIKMLEGKAIEEEREKDKLTISVNQLEKKVAMLERMTKEKDEGLMDLGEEKREAIRQLCQWIDYHRDRNDYLKEVLSKFPIRSQRAT